MANARINLKNIDYFKFKKMIIDGNRDDFSACSKEVKLLCDCVQTVNFRDEEFDDESDRQRFDELCSLYRQILSSKRIEPTDMKIKSGWWGDHKNAYSAGKLKAAVLRTTLVEKANAWVVQHPGCCGLTDVGKQIGGPGLYVFKHKEHQCFQYVGRASNVFAACAEKLKAAFEATASEPIAALMTINMSSDWDFYFQPVGEQDNDTLLRILQNDLILKHDSIWPHGLNFNLHIDSLLEVSQFRKSCVRHRWPPSDDAVDDVIDIPRLRKTIDGVRDDTPPPEAVDRSASFGRKSRNSSSETSSTVSETSLRSSKKTGDKSPGSRPAAAPPRVGSAVGKKEGAVTARTTRSSNLVSPRPTTADKMAPRAARHTPQPKARVGAKTPVTNVATEETRGEVTKSPNRAASATKKPDVRKAQPSPIGSPVSSPARSPARSLASSVGNRSPSRIPLNESDKKSPTDRVEPSPMPDPSDISPAEPVDSLPAEPTETPAVESEDTAPPTEDVSAPTEENACPPSEDVSAEVSPEEAREDLAVATDVVPGRRSSTASVSSGGTWTIEDCDEKNLPDNVPVINLTSEDVEKEDG